MSINIRKIIEGTIDDMVFRDEPKKKHVKRMGKDWGPLTGFPIDKFKNNPPPPNESGETEAEIKKLDSILVDDDFVESADDVDSHFIKFLESKGLEYPKEDIKKYMSGVRSIILQLKYHYNRPRPGQIAQAKGMDTFDPESLKSASTPSYPSGHATQGRFISKLLADMYPEYGEQLIKIGDDIAYSRNMAKVHYPSDSKFGKKLGDELYDYISKSKITETMKHYIKNKKVKEQDLVSIVHQKLEPLANLGSGLSSKVKEVKNKYGIEVLEDAEYLYKKEKTMKKPIKIKESDISRLVKKILREHTQHLHEGAVCSTHADCPGGHCNWSGGNLGPDGKTGRCMDGPPPSPFSTTGGGKGGDVRGGDATVGRKPKTKRELRQMKGGTPHNKPGQAVKNRKSRR